MRRIFVISVLLVFAGQDTVLSKQTDFSTQARILNRIKESVVTIHAFSSLHENKVGTGMVIHDRGFIATRPSVIQNADSVYVYLYNGRHFLGHPIHHDQDNEVALLYIDASSLRPIETGNDSLLALRDMMTLMGNSLGVFPSVALALYEGRHPSGVFEVRGLIPPGNMGSPIIDSRGVMVGMLCGRTLSPEAHSETHWALPASRIEALANELNGRLEGWIGLSAVDLENGAPGARIVSVRQNGPARWAGFQVGDTLLTVENRSIESAVDLARQIRKLSLGRRITFETVHGGPAFFRTVQIFGSFKK